MTDILGFKKKVYAIDVEKTSTDKHTFSLMVLTLNKGVFDFEMPTSNSSDLSEIRGYIPEQAPVCLIVGGKGIIHREIEEDSQQDNKRVLKQILLDADPSDFYIQRHDTGNQGQKGIVSIVRKKIIDDIITLFSGLRLFITGISIGPFSIRNILPLLETNRVFLYKNLLVHYDSTSVLGFEHTEPSSTSILIEGKELDTNDIPSLSIGLAFLMGEDVNYANIPLIDNQKEEYRYRSKTISVCLYSLFTLFGLLLVNFLIFDHYYKKNSTLRSEAERQEILLKQVTDLTNTYESKSQFIRESGLLGQTYISKHLDMIAQTVPSCIVFDEIIVNPPQKSSSKKDVKYTPNIITITGNCSENSYQFNEWIKQMKQLQAFKNVSILKYEYKDKEMIALFSIEIEL